MPVKRKRVGQFEGISEFGDVSELIDLLNGTGPNGLQAQGYRFQASSIQPSPGFVRIYVGRGNAGSAPDLFLDLRVGEPTPVGLSIEMLSHKPKTYGVPGAAQLLDPSHLVSPLKTFNKFVRAIYARSEATGKTPQECVWPVYMEGDQNLGLLPNGAVLTPGASEGLRTLTAKTVVINPPEDFDEQKVWREQVQESIQTGRLRSLVGYDFEPKKGKSLIPTTAMVEYRADRNVERIMGETIRGVGSDPKSNSTLREARVLSRVPLIHNAQSGRFERVPASRPTTGRGFRTGWTRLAGTLPGEARPDYAFMQSVLLAETFDLPGAMQLSTSAFRVASQPGGPATLPVDYVATEGIASEDLGIVSLTQLNALMDSDFMGFEEMQGKKHGKGPGRFLVGTLGPTGQPISEGTDPDQLYAKLKRKYESEKTPGRFTFKGRIYMPDQRSGELAFQEVVPLSIPKRAYPMVSEKPTVYVPAFADKDNDYRFTNLPGEAGNTNIVSTLPAVEALRKKYGDRVNFESFGLATGNSTSPATPNIVVPTLGLVDPAAKTAGLKAGLTQLFSQLRADLADLGPQPLAAVTQEGKIPTRLLQTNFLSLNRLTAIDYMREMLPHDTEEQRVARKGVRDFINRAYAEKMAVEELERQGIPYSERSEDIDVNIDLDKLAEVYFSYMGENGTADMLFQRIGKRIQQIGSRKGGQAKLWDEYRLGFPKTQMVELGAYSQSEMEAYRDLVAEQWQALPEAERQRIEALTGGGPPVQFKEINQPAKRKVKQKRNGQTEEVEVTVPKMYRASQLIIGGGQTLAINAGLRMTPEWPSGKEFVNMKALMSLLEEYPETSQKMGLLKSIPSGKNLKELVKIFAGPLAATGANRPSAPRSSWFGMGTWMGFQQDLREYRLSIPAEAVPMTPDLANALIGVLEETARGQTSEERVDLYRRGLRNLNLEQLGIAPGTDLSKSFFIDKNTFTLLPRFEDIAGIESYKQGLQKGQTVTFNADRYFRLVGASAEATLGSMEANVATVMGLRDQFFGHIERQFFNSKTGQRAKEIYRYITGVELPGMTGGKYQGSSMVASDEAVADDNYLRQVLRLDGYSNDDINSILSDLAVRDDAYVPLLFQRFPDVSGKAVWLPAKVRSESWYKNRGLMIKGNRIGRSSILFVSQTYNAEAVGDFDDDPYSAKVLPMDDFDPKTKKRTGQWRIAEAALNEFATQVGFYAGKDGPAKVLQAMYGTAGVKADANSLDVRKKNLAEYLETVRTGTSNLTRRLDKVGWTPLYGDPTLHTRGFMDILKRQAHYQKGKGVSYNRRTLTEDIMDAVLARSVQGPDERAVLEKAYEAGAFAYQYYLDLQASMDNGYTALEEMMNTITTAFDPEGGYAVRYKSSEQGTPDEQLRMRTDPETGKQTPSGIWNKLWTHTRSTFKGNNGTVYPLRNILTRLAVEPTEKMTNAQLAWGFASEGHIADVYKALEEAGVEGQERANLLNLMTSGQGEQGSWIGARSPFFATALYSLVERTIRKNPAKATDATVQLPWIDGKVHALPEILASGEYRDIDTLVRLLLRSRKFPGAQEFERLDLNPGTRLGKIWNGIKENWRTLTGGIAPVEQGAQEWYDKYVENVKRVSDALLASNPEVHASELGSLAGPERVWQGWHPMPKKYAKPLMAQTLMRWAGFPQLFGGRGYGDTPWFELHREKFSRAAREGSETVPIGEPVGDEIDPKALGIDWEKAFAKEHAGRVHHVGEAKVQKIRLQVNGLNVVGTPDFIGYEEENGGQLLIEDTKYAAADPSLNTEEGAHAARNVRAYHNRIQQIAYAYGLEQLAKRSKDEGRPELWLDLMRGKEPGQGFQMTQTTPERLLEMREAAAAGRIKIALRPGHATTAEYKEYAPIPIEYNESARNELRAITNKIRKDVLTQEEVAKAALTIGRVLETSQLPPELAEVWRFTGAKPLIDTDRLKVMGGQRLAGGGLLRGRESQVIRVGEGGPEDIEFRGNSVRVVPTYKLPNKAKPSGYIKGYAFEDEPFNPSGANEPEPGGPTTPPPHQPPPPPPSGAGFQGPINWDAMAQKVMELLTKFDAHYERANANQEKIIEQQDKLIAKEGILKVSYPAKPSQTSAVKLNAQMETGLYAASLLRPTAEAFDTDLKLALMEELDSENLTKPQLAAYKKARSGNAMDVLRFAAKHLPREQMAGVLRGFVPRSKEIGALFPLVETLQGITTKGEFDRLLPELNPSGNAEINSIVESMYEPDPSDQSPDGIRLRQEYRGMVSAVSAAKAITTTARFTPEMKPSRLSEFSPEAFDKFYEAMENSRKAIDNWSEAVKTGTKVTETKHMADIRMAEYEKAYYGGLRESLGKDLGDLSGKTRAEARKLWETGKINDQAIADFEAYQEAGKKEQGADQRLQKLAGTSATAQGWNKVLRELMGGWGLMYMSTLLSYGTENYTQGYQGQQERAQGLYGAVAQAYGARFRPANEELAYQNALSLGGNLPWRATRQMQAMTASGGISDMGGAVMRGLGIGGLSVYFSNALGDKSIFGITGEGLEKWAPRLAVGAAVAGLVGNQISYAMNPRETGMAVGASLRRAEQYSAQGNLLGWWGAAAQNIGAAWQNALQGPALINGQMVGEPGFNPKLGAIEYEPGASYADIYGAEGVESPFSKIKHRAYTWGEYYKAAADQALAGGFAGAGALPVPTTELPGVIGTIAAGTEFGNFDKNTVAKLVTLYNFNKMLKKDTSDLVNMASAVQQGINYQPAAQGINFLLGQGAVGQTEEGLVRTGDYLINRRNMTNYELAPMAATAGFLTDLPTSRLAIAQAGTPQAAARLIDQYTRQWQNVIGTPWEQPVGQAQVSLETAQGLGISTGPLAQLIGMAQAGAPGPGLLSALRVAGNAAEQAVGWRERIQTQGLLQGLPLGAAGGLINQTVANLGEVQGQQFLSGLLSGNPLMFSSLAAGGTDLSRYTQSNLLGQPASWASLDVAGRDLTGAVNGTGLYQTSLLGGDMWNVRYGQPSTHMLSAYENAQLIFGPGWQQNRFMTGAAGFSPQQVAAGLGLDTQPTGQVVPGFEAIGPVAGMRWLQLSQMNLSHQAALASAGAQMAQLQLSSAFQTGVGLNKYTNIVNPQTGTPFGFNTGSFTTSIAGVGSFTSAGGGLWGLEDTQRGLQNLQTQWGWQMQSQQMALQKSQFAENLGFNMQNAQMQRGWAVQDWGYQDTTRNLQWQWKTEDFQEQARFMTGRERRLAERQMGRETVMHNLEGEQIDKTRERQKELWAREDERFLMEKRQFDENRRLEEQAFEKQKEFYTEQKRLQDEQIKMQRAYWVEQQRIQQAAAGAQAHYAEESYRLQVAMTALSIAAGDAELKAKLLTPEFAKWASEYLPGMAEWMAKIAGIELPNPHQTPNGDTGDDDGGGGGGGGKGGRPTTGNPITPNPDAGGGGGQRAWGGRVNAGETVWVNDTELFRADMTGMVIPLGKAQQMNPWNQTVLGNPPPTGEARQPIAVSVYIGDRYLGEYITDTVKREVNLP